MSDYQIDDGWWQASDGKWYPPNMTPGAPSAAPAPSAVPQFGPERPTSTGAFVCGVIGSVIGLIPLLGIIAIPLGLVGFFLGLSGWRRKPERAKLARASTILGGLAVVLGIVGIVILVNAADDLDDELDRIGDELEEDLDRIDDEAEALVAAVDVEIGGCPAGGTVTGTATSSADVPVNVYATVVLLDADGVQIGDTLGAVQALAPGRTATWEGAVFEVPYATCELGPVEVFESTP